jgi:hypothetical protein
VKEIFLVPSRRPLPEPRRTIQPKKAIVILKKLLGESMVLPGEPFTSPKRSQWKDTARGALEQAGLSSSLLDSFDQSQGPVFDADSTDEEMRQLANQDLAAMTAVLNSAIEQLGWQLEEEEPAAKPIPEKPSSAQGTRAAERPAFRIDMAYGEARLMVNGVTWGDTRVDSEGELVEIWGESVPRVAKLRLNDLVAEFERITISLPGAEKDLENWDFAYIEIESSVQEMGEVSVAFRLECDLEFWAKAYSISDLATAIESALARHETPFVYWQNDKNTTINGFGVAIALPLENMVEEALDKEKELKELVLLIRNELGERDTRAVNLVFDFPAPIKNACEQYLLYFVQFLSDLGIEASAEVKEQASRVLFSVTPADEKQALEKIREALQAYLDLPLAPEFAKAAGGFHDAAVSQLQANVLHLQSQIALAKAAIEMKNAALDAKDAHIALLQDRIDLRTFQPQMDAPDAAKEELVKDVVSLKKWDYKFVEINFPELLRKLKRKLE